MTFVRCPSCQRAYQVHRCVEYAEPFVCSACGQRFNYGGAEEARPGAVEETLRIPGAMKVLSRASRRMPTIRPPAALRDIDFEAGYDVRRLTELVKGYPTVLPPKLVEYPEDDPGWVMVAGHWRYVGEGLDIGLPVKEFVASYGELLDDLRRRVSHVAVRLTARELSSDPDIPQDDMSLPLEKDEGLLWRGLAGIERRGADGSAARSETEGWMFLTSERVLYFEGDGCLEYRLDAITDVWTNWRDRAGVLRLTMSDGETVSFTADEAWRPAMFVLYVWNRSFRLHFCTNDQEAVVQDLCDSLCNPLSFRDEATWPTGEVADSFVFADLFAADLMPRWHRCQW